MVKVQFTATVFNPDTEESFNGWVDPSWNAFELRSDTEDVRTFEFDNMEDAMEFIEDAIGSMINTGHGTYYAENVRMNAESGEEWSYAAHINEDDETKPEEGVTERVQELLQNYSTLTGNQGMIQPTLQQLLVDLRHYAYGAGIDFEQVDQDASESYCFDLQKDD